MADALIPSSNNSLKGAMKSLSLSPATISAVVDDPAVLSSPNSVSLSSSQAAYILSHGYTKGFRTVFILHGCLAALATITSILMIKHKELTRGDEERLKTEAKNRGDLKSRDLEKSDVAENPDSTQVTTLDGDIEMGRIRAKEADIA